MRTRIALHQLRILEDPPAGRTGRCGEADSREGASLYDRGSDAKVVPRIDARRAARDYVTDYRRAAGSRRQDKRSSASLVLSKTTQGHSTEAAHSRSRRVKVT